MIDIMKGKIEMQQNDNGEKNKKVLISQDLLSLKKQNRGKKIVKSLLRNQIEPQRKRKVFETYKDAESPLLHRLQDFFPKFKESTIDIASKPDDERKKLDIENVDDCSDTIVDDDDDLSTGADVDNNSRVIEMNLIFGQMGSDSSSSEEDSSSDSENEREIVKEFHPESLKIVEREQRKEQKCSQKKLISEVTTCASVSNSSKENR